MMQRCVVQCFEIMIFTILNLCIVEFACSNFFWSGLQTFLILFADPYIYVYIYIYICYYIYIYVYVYSTRIHEQGGDVVQNSGPDPFAVSDADTMVSYLKTAAATAATKK
jgi:Ca2+/Na+ antiporter